MKTLHGMERKKATRLRVFQNADDGALNLPNNTMTCTPCAHEKCKILLPKFNTWKQGQIERKKGSLTPFDNTVGRFFAKNVCRYGAIASRLHRNGNAITP